MSFRELLFAEFRPYGELSTEQLDQLERHYELLMQWNRRLNLTRILDLTEVVQFHYCESLFLGTILPTGPAKVGDLGSGAGFPGIPLAILRPDVELILFESDQRKAVFLREASRHLANVQVMALRFQDFKGKLDWVVSRAVALSEIFSCGLAHNRAVLSSGEGPSPASEFELVRTPWGDDRRLIVSRGTVPRETPRGKIS